LMISMVEAGETRERSNFTLSLFILSLTASRLSS